MIRLFNRIRKQLLDENRTSRYLKYALGEILLVMIGILRARQVNNWNQTRQVKKEELKVLKGLHQEFIKNLSRFDTTYKRQKARRDEVVITMTSNFEEFTIERWDSIHVINVAQWTFDPLKGVYNSVINSGKLDLISSDELKTKISKFQDLVIDYKEEELNTNNFGMNTIYPFIIENFPSKFGVWSKFRERTIEEEKVAKQAYIDLYKDQAFENMMTFLIAYMSAIFEEGPILREEMVSIIGLLEEEIEKHK